MNKTISLILLIASIGLLSATADFTATALTSFSPVNVLLNTASPNIPLTFGAAPQTGDEVIFTQSTTTPPTIAATDPIISVSSTTLSQTGTFTPQFTVAGDYTVYLRRGAAGTPVLQTGLKMTAYNQIGAAEITAITPPSVVFNTATETLSFTIAATNSLIRGVDKIVFSTAATPADSDPSVTITGSGLVTGSYSGTVSAAFVINTYNVFIKRGVNIKQQAGLTFIVVAVPLETQVTALSKTTAITDKTTAIPITITFGTSATGDKVVFSTSATPAATDPSVVLDTPTSKIASLVFPVAGVYSVFVQRANKYVKQTGTGVQLTITLPAPSATLITAVSPATAVVGTAASLSFTLGTGMVLTTDDSIVFSTKDTTTTSDPLISVTADTTTTTFTGSMNFAAAGNYNVFVDNGAPIKQTGIVIAVSASSFISLTLGLGALLFLF